MACLFSVCFCELNYTLSAEKEVCSCFDVEKTPVYYKKVIFVKHFLQIFPQKMPAH